MDGSAPVGEDKMSVPVGLDATVLGSDSIETLNKLKKKALALEALPHTNGSNALSNKSMGSSALMHNAQPVSLQDKTLNNANPLLNALSLFNANNENNVGVTPDTSKAAQHLAFMKEFSSVPTNEGVLRVNPPGSVLRITQGSIIPAALSRDIVSDLPGTLTAVVTQDVYDSLTSRVALICKGAKLVGRYNSEVRVGQSRLFFAFSRLILKTGESFDLGGFEGADASGKAGYEGDVNNHFLKLYGASLAIGVMADQVTKQEVLPQGGFAQPSATGQIMVQTTRDILQRSRDVAPSITVSHGSAIVVEVKRDLVFEHAPKGGCA
jgi:type IV secretion system protein VirB10